MNEDCIVLSFYSDTLHKKAQQQFRFCPSNNQLTWSFFKSLDFVIFISKAHVRHWFAKICKDCARLLCHVYRNTKQGGTFLQSLRMKTIIIHTEHSQPALERLASDSDIFTDIF